MRCSEVRVRVFPYSLKFRDPSSRGQEGQAATALKPLLNWAIKTELAFYPGQRNFTPVLTRTSIRVELTSPLPSSPGPGNRKSLLAAPSPQGPGPASYIPWQKPRPPSFADLEKITFLSPSYSFLICKTVCRLLNERSSKIMYIKLLKNCKARFNMSW